MRLLLLLLPLGFINADAKVLDLSKYYAPDDFSLSCKGKDWFTKNKLVLNHYKIYSETGSTLTFYRGFWEDKYISSNITFEDKDDDYYKFGKELSNESTLYLPPEYRREQKPRYYSPLRINRETLELKFNWGRNGLIEMDCKVISINEYFRLYRNYESENEKKIAEEKERIKKKNKI